MPARLRGDAATGLKLLTLKEEEAAEVEEADGAAVKVPSAVVSVGDGSKGSSCAEQSFLNTADFMQINARAQSFDLIYKAIFKHCVEANKYTLMQQNAIIGQ